MSRNIVITGVSRGIGAATAKLFHESGWSVFGIDIADSGPDCLTSFVQADLSNYEQTMEAVKVLSGKLASLEALVNNAARQICKPILQTTVEDWDLIMATNVRSAFVLCREFYPHLKAGRGSIVNVSSVHAVATSADISAYAASKGALSAFTRSLAIEYASDHIRVNAILPGAINTDMLDDGLYRNGPVSELHTHKAALEKKTPLGKIGEPDDIARMIHFLSSTDTAGFITGQNFIVDGGALCKLGTE